MFKFILYKYLCYPTIIIILGVKQQNSYCKLKKKWHCERSSNIFNQLWVEIYWQQRPNLRDIHFHYRKSDVTKAVESLWKELMKCLGLDCEYYTAEGDSGRPFCQWPSSYRVHYWWFLVQQPDSSWPFLRTIQLSKSDGTAFIFDLNGLLRVLSELAALSVDGIRFIWQNVSNDIMGLNNMDS